MLGSIDYGHNLPGVIKGGERFIDQLFVRHIRVSTKSLFHGVSYNFENNGAKQVLPATW